MEYTFGGKYKLEHEIGLGGCGSVFMGTHTIAGKEVAIKVESAHAKHSMLKQESRIYKTLMGGPGVPWMMWSGKQGDYNVMVIDLLGPSLEDLFRICNKSFSLKTVLLITDQMLSLIEFIHSRDWVHRDVKPANFLMGPDIYSTSRPSSCDRVNVIDFGLAKKYTSGADGQHIKNSLCDSHGVGTPLFASINTHRGEDCSRRDDLESLAYTLIYFLKGTLPWRKIRPPPAAAANPKLAWDKILQSKLAAEASGVLTAGLPTEFDIFYRGLMRREGWEFDGVFDWSVVGDRVWRRGRGRSASGPVAPAAPGAGAKAGVKAAHGRNGNGNGAAKGNGAGEGVGPGSGPVNGGIPNGGGRRRRFCEACEAKAQELLKKGNGVKGTGKPKGKVNKVNRMSVSQPPSLTRRVK